MDRYHFDVWAHGHVDRDEEGQELPDLKAVYKAAVEGARELMAYDVRAGIEPDGRTFRVRTSQNEVVLTLPFIKALKGAQDPSE